MEEMDRKGWIFIALGLFAAIFVFSSASIHDPADVHFYADQRLFLGIPNFNNVIATVLFLILGVMGLWKLGHQKKSLQTTIWMIFFSCIVGLALGSGYYHLKPTNERLFWDRLFISTAFMALLAGVLAERISLNVMKKVAPFLILAGMGSVFYWGWTGDIRFYLLMQYFPIIALPLLCLCFPMKGDRYIYGVVIFYILAKVVEVYDVQIFNLTHQVVSGLTLKQLAAAVSVYFVYRKSD
jgi:hypothetical protein